MGTLIDFQMRLLDLIQNNLTSALTYVNFDYTLISGNLTSLVLSNSIKTLFISFTQVTGEIPTLPDSLLILSAQSLQLNGAIKLSKNQMMAYYDGNHFTGIFPILPTSMLYFSVKNGYSTNQYTIFDLPSQLYHFDLTNCHIYGRFNTINSKMYDLMVGGNHLNGSIILPNGINSFQ
eukprot:NODE_571_length_5897_cov_0.529148.p5 type:complete len:177 gc:universal NODE_571_length_5897_cov_0.529148:5190-4660(-)